VDTCEFEIASWLKGCQALLDEARPVVDCEEEVAGMDEVEGVGPVRPGLFGIVDFEDAVRCCPVRLDGGDVAAGYGGGGEEVCYCECPDALDG
jgi:hypothetical protein